MQVSFTLFGLWLVVVQLRRAEWVSSQSSRRGARLIAMHFALPGIMSLLNLSNPDSSLLWRISFAAFAALGGVGVLLLDRPTQRDPAQRLVHLTSVALYAAVAFVALFADVVAFAFGVNALRVEAVLLSLLLFLSLNFAFSMLFGPTASEPSEQGGH